LRQFSLALALSLFIFPVATPVSASTLSAHDFGKGYVSDRHDDDGHSNWNNQSDKDGDKDKKDFTRYDNDDNGTKLCDPKDNYGSKDKEHGSDKISYSWNSYSDHDHDEHDYPKISYPAYLPWPTSDNNHHDYNHHVGDGDHDEDDHKKITNYYRDICDHQKDHDYDPSHQCDPKDPGKAPLPDAFFLFASALGVLGFFSFKRQKPNRTL
jgi:hypothetical protein